MAVAMEAEMEFSDGEETNNAKPNVAASQYSTPPMYNSANLIALYGNSATGLDIEMRQNHEHGAGYIFMCNGRTKADCFRYRVFGIPRGGKEIVEGIKPGMKLFLYDFEKKLLYGVYEATIGGKLDIEPEAFDKKYPAQVGFRIVMNCYPLPENTFKSAIYENYKGSKFKQELTPHQVLSLLALFRPFTAPELDLLPHRLASRASTPRALSFEDRFATQLRNSSVLDSLSGRHAEPRLGSLMAHQSVGTSLFQHSYSRQDGYSTPPKEALSLSKLNQSYHSTESQQQRSSIQDPQLKYLTILSNIRRYGSAPESLASENEYYPASPSERDQFASPYSDEKYYPSKLSGNEHSSASAAGGSVYKNEFYTLASKKDGEASQKSSIPHETYYHPEASIVPNTTVSMQAVSVAQSQTQTAGYTPANAEASQPAPGAVGYTPQLQNVANTYSTHLQPGSMEASTHSYAGTYSYTQPQYYEAMGHTTQFYVGGTGYIQQPHAAATGYNQQAHAAATGYAQQTHVATSGYTQQPHTAATEYAQQAHAVATGYAQQAHAAENVYAQQTPAATSGYSPLSPSAATGYIQQPNAATTGYALQPHAQVVGYTPQYYGQAAAGYTQQAVTQGSIPVAPGTAVWNAANQASGDWNAVNQSYNPSTADATTTTKHLKFVKACQRELYYSHACRKFLNWIK